MKKAFIQNVLTQVYIIRVEKLVDSVENSVESVENPQENALLIFIHAV